MYEPQVCLSQIRNLVHSSDSLSQPANPSQSSFKWDTQDEAHVRALETRNSTPVTVEPPAPIPTLRQHTPPRAQAPPAKRPRVVNASAVSPVSATDQLIDAPGPAAYGLIVNVFYHLLICHECGWALQPEPASVIHHCRSIHNTFSPPSPATVNAWFDQYDILREHRDFANGSPAISGIPLTDGARCMEDGCTFVSGSIKFVRSRHNASHGLRRTAAAAVCKVASHSICRFSRSNSPL